MTATHHTSLFRFAFPDGATAAAEDGRGEAVVYSPLVLVDLQDLAGSRHGGVGTGVRVDAKRGRITGEGMFRPSFGTGQYAAYFCADFRGAKIRRSGTFMGDTPDEARQALEQGNNGAGDAAFHIPSGAAGGWVQFEPPATGGAILARVGMSFVSQARACQHAEREIPTFDFAKTVAQAETAWRAKLGAVQVDETDVDPALLVTFWSGLYRTMVSPQDYTGENQLWESGEPYFDS